MQVKVKEKYKNFVKFPILLLAYSFIIYKLLIEKDIFEYFRFLDTFSFSNIIMILFVLGLMFVNWSIEAFKWKLIVSKFENISLKSALISVFTGVTVGIFTPNRIGEPGGRILNLKRENRFKGVSSSFLGSFSQSIVTYVFGIFSIIAIAVLSNNYILGSTEFIYIIVGIIILAVCQIIVFLKFSFIFEKLKKFKIVRRGEKHISFFKKYSKLELLEIFAHSFFRYLVYVTQYYLLLEVFGVKISFIEAYISISAIYLIISIIPSFVLADLGIRGSVSIFIIGLFSASESGIFISYFVLWIINIVLPSIIGSFFLYKSKI